MSRTHIPAKQRRLVRLRAAGKCEYCRVFDEDSFAVYTIDHIIAEKHGGQTELDNLAYCCLLCNQHKGTDVASCDTETGNLTPLFNPRKDRWVEHFGVVKTGEIIPVTAVGRVTTRLLKLNQPARIKERHLLIDSGFFEEIWEG